MNPAPTTKTIAVLVALSGLSWSLGAPLARATDLIGGAQPEILTPEEAQKTFTLAEGYEISLYASEVEFPDLQSPAAMTFDSEGRLWVACIPSHPHAKPGVPLKDRILILEDTDKDGKADQHTIFHEGLYLPMGLALADGNRTVYAVSEPNLMRLTDTDGNGQADEERIELHGFGTEDNHHVISAFQWGPGGRLFFGQGLFLNTQVETPYGPVRAYEAAVFRLDPRDHRLEVFAEYGWSNVWGLVFDHWGQPLLADASPALNYYLPHHTAPGDYPREGKYDHARRVRGSMSFTPEGRRPSCGNELLLSEHFPEEVQGWYVTNQMKGWHGVRWYKLEDEGSGVKATQPKGDEELLTTTDTTFRPAALQVGPDGALYVLDYYNPIVGHTTYNFRDPRRIQTHGRVWRITHKDRPLVWQPKIAGEPVDVLIDHLKNPNHRTRYFARRELQEKTPDEVIPALKEWIARLDANEPDYEHHLVEALWIEQGLNEHDFDLLRKLLAAKDYRARTAAVRVLRHWQEPMDDVEALKLIQAALRDESQKVRLEGLIACGYYPDRQKALETAASVLDQEMDLGFTHAAQQTFSFLAGKVDRVPAAVEDFLLPYIDDAELLTRELTVPVAKERLNRLTLTVDAHRAAATVLAAKAGQNDSDWLAAELANVGAGTESADRTTVACRLLLNWPAENLPAIEPQLKQLAASSKDATVRAHVSAALLKMGRGEQLAATEAAGARVDWLSGIKLLGRGKTPGALFERVSSLADGKESRSVRLAAVEAASYFPEKDKDALVLLASVADETSASDLTLSFAALESMKRIPRNLWPEDYTNKTLNRITVSATPDLKFDPAQFSVKAGSAVELRFTNPDNMYHNLVIVKPGTMDEIGLQADMMAGRPDGLEKHYVPEHPGVLHWTPQLTLGVARSHILRFYAPEEPGEYPYICTFPGHWRVMKGIMTVTK